MNHVATSQASGEEGSRTPDPLLAKQMLYQLSYFPDFVVIFVERDRAAFSAGTWIRTKDLSFIRAAL